MVTDFRFRTGRGALLRYPAITDDLARHVIDDRPETVAMQAVAVERQFLEPRECVSRGFWCLDKIACIARRRKSCQAQPDPAPEFPEGVSVLFSKLSTFTSPKNETIRQTPPRRLENFVTASSVV